MDSTKIRHADHTCPKSGRRYSVMPRFVQIKRKKEVRDGEGRK